MFEPSEGSLLPMMAWKLRRLHSASAMMVAEQARQTEHPKKQRPSSSKKTAKRSK